MLIVTNEQRRSQTMNRFGLDRALSKSALSCDRLPWYRRYSVSQDNEAVTLVYELDLRSLTEMDSNLQLSRFSPA